MLLYTNLAACKMKQTKTYQQYFLHMKELATHGTIKDEALIEYIIDGIQDTEFNKVILYGATDLK